MPVRIFIYRTLSDDETKARNYLDSQIEWPKNAVSIEKYL